MGKDSEYIEGVRKYSGISLVLHKKHQIKTIDEMRIGHTSKNNLKRLVRK